MEKNQIWQASILLGSRKCRPDGKGGFLLKGLKTPLKHYQVLGAAFMKERELGPDGPIGGICADELGLGKTLQMLACIIANPSSDPDCKTDLLITSPALIRQWLDEIDKHVESPILETVCTYQSARERLTRGTERSLKSHNLVCTTWDEVRKSYGKAQPPPEYITREQQVLWWKDYWEENRGLLHRVQWRRCILDEAHAIKNRNSATFMAVEALEAKVRWAITATPITNSALELHPYFAFLRVKQAGRFDTFKHNFIEPQSDIANGRLHAFLRQFMLRRTYPDMLLGAPLLKLPKNHHHTIPLQFDPGEHILYLMVKTKYAKKINQFQRKGETERHRRTILTYLLRLRQMCSHPYLIQEEIEDLIDGEDIEALWRRPGKTPDMLLSIRKAFQQRKDSATGMLVEPEEIPEDDGLRDTRPIVFEFRKHLRHLKKSKRWGEALKRTLCTRCSQPCGDADPYVTSCMHLYCGECLNTLMVEAAAEGENNALCLECGVKYTESQPCEGLKELNTDSASDSGNTPRRRRRRPDNSDEPEKHDWMSLGGKMLQSTKSLAVVHQIREWMTREKNVKIIIFTQFDLMIAILARSFKEQGWGFVKYNGKMSQNSRENAIKVLRDNAKCQIMICGLKCGGFGLNLTMASKAILIEGWCVFPIAMKARNTNWPLKKVEQSRGTAV